jgi:hypothetical protein
VAVGDDDIEYLRVHRLAKARGYDAADTKCHGQCAESRQQFSGFHRTLECAFIPANCTQTTQEPCTVSTAFHPEPRRMQQSVHLCSRLSLVPSGAAAIHSKILIDIFSNLSYDSGKLLLGISCNIVCTCLFEHPVSLYPLEYRAFPVAGCASPFSNNVRKNSNPKKFRLGFPLGKSMKNILRGSG